MNSTKANNGESKVIRSFSICLVILASYAIGQTSPEKSQLGSNKSYPSKPALKAAEESDDAGTGALTQAKDPKVLEMARAVSNDKNAAGNGHGDGGHDVGYNREILKQPVPNKAKGSLPASPELLEPEFMQKVSGNSATLKWKGPEGVDSFHVQVASDPNFKWLVVNETMLSATTFQVQGLNVGQNYYWRVASQGKGKDAGWQKSFFTKSSFKTQ